ncbi:MAG: AAA family ATPase [Bacteroidota bacterium]
MKERLDELTIDNFRIFAGTNTFKFTDLNIYTGANNSGKSTIIKAIKLFADGLAKSDFPALNLISEDSNLGSYDSVINWYSNKKNFKIGFNTKIADIDGTFNVVYTFSEGKNKDELFRETALFAKLEIISPDGDVFFGIYSDYSPDPGDRTIRSIESPTERSDPGLVDFRLNIALLEKYLSKITDQDYTLLIKLLNSIKGGDNFWWGECFKEDEYNIVDYDISNLFFKDFEEDLALDRYYNLAGYKSREILYLDNDAINEKKQYQYNSNFLNYNGFINNVVHSILESVKTGLDLFRNNNILHIVSDISQERLIINNLQSQYLKRLYQILGKSENLSFIRRSLASFEIDGSVEIVPHLNTAFEVNLITNVQTVKNKKVENSKLNGRSYFGAYQESYKDYESNQRINIADLGKGTANIIKLILKTAAILFSSREEFRMKEELPQDQGRKGNPVARKTILVEEPEAFLHPNWQSKLMDFFMRCSDEFGVQFIIETHSVYLIQRLQYLVAKDDIEYKDVTILYFNSNDTAEKFYKINIRKDGILKESFGTGFYDETANLTADILNIQNIN